MPSFQCVSVRFSAFQSIKRGKMHLTGDNEYVIIDAKEGSMDCIR